jgi:hypothetical protein
MIPQRVSNSLVLLFVLWGGCCKVHAQQDTVVIYETQIVYDTLYVYDTVRHANAVSVPPLVSTAPINNYLSDSVARHLILNRNNTRSQTATFSKNDIIVPKGKSAQGNMKDKRNTNPLSKLISSDLNYGLSTGMGTWWAKGTDNSLRSKYIASQNLGVFAEYPVNTRFSLNAGLNFNWLYKNHSLFEYKDIQMDSAQVIRGSVLDSSALGSIVHWDIDGISDSAYSFCQFTLPIKLCLTVGNFQPYIGVEYVYRISGNGGRNASLLNATAGITVRISDRFSLAVNYSRGLINEFSRKGSIHGTINGNTIILANNTQINLPYSPESYMDKYSGPCKSQRLDITFCYHLSRKKNLRPKGFNP